MDRMFYFDAGIPSALEFVDATGWDLSSGYDMNSMFARATQLKTIVVKVLRLNCRTM